jgi:hypothetical protein
VKRVEVEAGPPVVEERVSGAAAREAAAGVMRSAAPVSAPAPVKKAGTKRKRR